MNKDKDETIDKTKGIIDEYEEDVESDKKSLAFRIFLFVACVFLLSVAFLYKPVLVDGASMEKTLLANDYAYSKRYIFESPKRFDIVVIKTNSKQKLNSKTIVKRIIGMPGDKLEISNGKLIINEKLTDELYIKGKLTQNLKITLGKDEYYVMGDNREESLDSRFFGPVKRKDLISKVFIVLLPIERNGEVK